MQPSPSQELSGQTTVVTGSSTGIGRAIALELARAGAAVLVHGRRSLAALEAVAVEVRGLGVPAQTVQADLADPANHERLVEQAWQWRGRVDIWVNNAGADVLTGPAKQWPFDEKLEALWRIDVSATMRLARMAGARMQQAGAGAIVNMGWDGAARGMAGDSAQLFGAAKGAIMAFSLSLAQSLAPAVRVNCLAPGWIRTAWGEHASEAWQERAKRESLLDRWGTPEDVARAVRFLVSPAAGFITGQTLPVNGGFRTA